MKFLRLLTMLLVMILLGAVLTSCIENTQTEDTLFQPRVVTDMAGQQVILPESVECYVVAWAAITDITAMFDGTEHLVAYPEKSLSFSLYQEVYPDLKDKICLSNEGISVETILESGAQVAFLKGSDDVVLVEKLRDCGIAVIDCEFKNYDQLKTVVRLVADVFGTEEALTTAEVYCEYLDKAVADAEVFTEALTDDERKTVLVIKDAMDYSAFGKTRYTGQWVEMCGGDYAMLNKDTYANVNLTREQILEYDPDILFFSMPGQAALFLEDPIWSEMTAVKNGDVYNIPSGLNTWSNSGAESALIFEWARATMYPEWMSYDPDAEVSAYYELFYGLHLTQAQINGILNPKR